MKMGFIRAHSAGKPNKLEAFSCPFPAHYIEAMTFEIYPLVEIGRMRLQVIDPS